MTLKIAIFDDEDEQRRGWIDRLEALEVGNIVPLNKFDEQVGILEERRIEARKKEQPIEKLDELAIESAFDDVDILIVDYDLLHTTRLTGEEIAYLLRCYSLCGLVVALNQFSRGKSFDLTLGGHLESFADLNIGSEFFDDPGLWNEDRSQWKAFRPWSWPALPELHKAFKKRIEDVARDTGQPVLSSLGLGSDTNLVLPQEALELIQSRKKAPNETTFEDFVKGSTSGLKPRDAEKPIKEMIPRIAAARLHRWLEAMVLGGQEILVDAPHLVLRYPSLLKGDVEDRGAWNETAELGLAHGIDHEKLQAFAYPHAHWLTRPAWYWPRVREYEEIPEVADPWSIASHEWVFCEDTSRFQQRSKARSFVAELPTSFSRRYVARLDSIEYHPSVRFSL